MKTKRCIYCNKEFILSAPNYDRQKICNSNVCMKKYHKEYHNIWSNKPEIKLKTKERMKKYNETYLKNQEVIDRRKKYAIKYQKEYYKIPEVRKRLIAQQKEYMQTPRGKKIHLQCSRKRRATQNNVVHVFTIKEWEDKVEKTNGVCPMCCNMFDDGIHYLTMDHIFPISKANEEFKKTGIKREYNIVDVAPLCKSCNSSKCDKVLKPKGLYTSDSLKY